MLLALIIGILIGTVLSWAGMLAAVDTYIFKSTDKDILIEELVKENNAYKEVVQRWRDKER